MDTGLRASRKSITGSSVPGPGETGHKLRKLPSAEIPDKHKHRGSTAGGLVVYVLLVLFTYVLGMTQPNTVPKSRPVPSERRTHCKQKPETFDKSVAKGKTVLVTGAAGFIGSYVARHCSEDLGMDVVGLDDYSGGAANIPFLSDIRIVKGHLSNATLLSHLFARHKFDVIYHVDGVSGSALSHHYPSKVYEANLVGTANLVTQAVKAKTPRFVLLSSTSVFGDAEGPWAESTMPKPSDPVGISKMAAEQHLRAAGAYFGLDYIILRVHSIYGPHMDFAPSKSTVVARAIQAATSGTPLTIHGEGKQKRQFTYVGDIAQLIAQAAFLQQREFHVIHVGSDEINSVAELVAEVEAVSGKSLDVKRGTEQTGAQHVQVVHDRSRCIFGVERFTSLRKGLGETFSWAARADLETRSQLFNFEAEILDQGGGGLAAFYERSNPGVQARNLHQ